MLAVQYLYLFHGDHELRLSCSANRRTSYAIEENDRAVSCISVDLMLMPYPINQNLIKEEIMNIKTMLFPPYA